MHTAYACRSRSSTSRRNGLNQIRAPGAARIGIVAAGTTYLDVRQALRALGLDDDELRRRGHPAAQARACLPARAGRSSRVRRRARRDHRGRGEAAFLETRSRTSSTAGRRARGRRQARPRRVHPVRPARRARRRRHRPRRWPALAARRSRPRRLAATGRPQRDPDRCCRSRRAPRTSAPAARTTAPPRSPEGSLVGAGIGCHAMVLLMDPRAGRRRHRPHARWAARARSGSAWRRSSTPALLPEHRRRHVPHSGSLASVRRSPPASTSPTSCSTTAGRDDRRPGRRSAARRSPDRTALLAEGVARIIVTTEEPAAPRRGCPAGGVEVRHRDDSSTPSRSWPRSRASRC